jgi:phosphoribosylformimino-5-aminoimidazole carboxamide ribotide isomerase
MLVIPAIDLKEGNCVRLKQGVFSEKKVYATKPLEVADMFQEKGARRLHLIDLDGAQSGVSGNADVIKAIVAELTIPVQVGGGIRSYDNIKFWLDIGVDRVIIGTLAVRDQKVVEDAIREFGAEKIVVAVDARDGMVAIDGWQKKSDISAVDLAMDFKEAGLTRVLYTDISRDGMFTGPNIETTKEIAIRAGLKVIASGGISRKADLDKLAELETFGVDSAVVGKAFYEGRIKPSEVF